MGEVAKRVGRRSDPRKINILLLPERKTTHTKKKQQKRTTKETCRRVVREKESRHPHVMTTPTRTERKIGNSGT